MDNLPNAFGYTRVSTHMQEDGASLETQRVRIAEYCKFKGLNLVKIYEDCGISGKGIEERKGLQEMIANLRKGDTVIVTDLSRFSRNTKDALCMLDDFKSKGITFVCLSLNLDSSSPVGALIVTVLMGVHTMERQNISSHVSSNMQRLSREGKLRSRPPFGWKFSGKNVDMTEDEDQQKVIREIIDLNSQGLKLAAIARRLNEEGKAAVLLNNKKTIPQNPPIFHAQTIRRILIDHGIIESKTPRPSLERRIVSHHKHETLQ